METVSQRGNMCRTCQYRWRDSDGHCYMWKHEPPVCLHFKVDYHKVAESMKPPDSAAGEET